MVRLFSAQKYNLILGLLLLWCPARSIALNLDLVPDEIRCEFTASGQNRYKFFPKIPAELTDSQFEYMMQNEGWIPKDILRDQIRYMGTGTSGSAYLIQRGNYSYIHKTSPILEALNDLLGSLILKRFQIDHLKTNSISWRWTNPQMLYSNDNTAKTLIVSNYVAGRSLFDLLNDPDLPDTFRNYFHQKFQEFIKSISANWQDRGGTRSKFTSCFFHYPQHPMDSDFTLQPDVYSFEISKESVQSHFPEELQTLINQLPVKMKHFIDHSLPYYEFIIKSDNIIVDENFNMVLVDPS